MTILYFGCMDRAGHYLWHPTRGKLNWQETKSTPWGNGIDGCLLQGKPYEAGVVYHEQRGGWSMVSFCDYTGDSRPGSHSTFVVESLMSAAELVAAAKVAWPGVFARFGAAVRLPAIPA